MSVPDVTVSIVSYNTRDLLQTCLMSLTRRQSEGEADLETIVADNGSTDGTQGMIQTQFPQARVLQTGGNLGYGRANNLALADAAGRYFLILNSDTVVEPGALRTMVDFLESTPECGMVGPRLVLPDGTTQPSCFGPPTLAAVFWEQTYLHQLMPGNRITGGFEMTYWKHDTRRAVRALSGAAIMVRRELFQKVAGFDPHYFMYFEDIDLCLRVGEQGARLWFLPDAVIRHNPGSSSQADWRSRARMVTSYNQSRYYYFTKTRGAGQGRLLKAIVLLGSGLRLTLWSVMALFRPAARVQARLFLDVWRRTWAMKSSGMEGPIESA